jgi:hypothetical protein
MGTRTALIRNSLICIGSVAVGALILGRPGVLAGFVAGLGIGLANFLFLQSSVQGFGDLSQGGAGAGVRMLTWFGLRFFLKLLVIAVVLFASVALVKLNWLGMLGGLCAAMALYLNEVFGQWRSYRNQ